MTQTTTKQQSRRRNIWYRDGFIITEDVSRAELKTLNAKLSDPNKDPSVGGTRSLVVFTPTPLDDGAGCEIGYISFQLSSSHRHVTTTDLVVSPKWRHQGLEEWMEQCAKEYLEMEKSETKKDEKTDS
jgi:hypothetical protein